MSYDITNMFNGRITNLFKIPQSQNNLRCTYSTLSSLCPQIRRAHTDMKTPDFTNYMRNSVKNPTAKTSESDGERKTFTNLIVAAGLTIGLYSAKAEITREISYMAPSADVLALAKIEINLSDIAEGVSATFKWRGKPLFVKSRTADEIAVVRAVPLKNLRDPATDEERCPRPEWLVVIGICTHLGCVPIANAGDYGPGGFYCPCHGSHFDAAGRTRKGPAPTNMDIPEHRFINDNTLVVG